jgi:asparagine synthase (glutamine-hydrolysing)
MCGICGVIGIESKEVGEAVVRRMMRAIVHRGPDEEGVLLASPVALGSRRLSIIDLPGGNQPIWNEAGTIAIVYNGEIYNFSELRKELQSNGHTFRTNSDTEVVVHAYENWGVDCVKRLRGMFAFAIVEMPQGPAGRPERVFLARDRLGIKPLYYAKADRAFFFASEVRALLASGCIARKISAEALPSYLLFGSLGEPMTLVEGVVSLPPGHSLTVAVASTASASKPVAYWSVLPEFAKEKRATTTATQQAQQPQQVRSLLEDAVRSHLIADVPVGVFLSSGLDSTALAALASRVQGGIHTFTVAFPDEEFSEAKIARRTAKKLGTDHTEFTLSQLEMAERLDEAIAAFDQPSMDGVNTYFVSWAARQSGLKVALSGLGSDELFGGYSSFANTKQAARLAQAARFFPPSFRRSVARQLTEGGLFGLSADTTRKAAAAWRDPASLPHAYFFTRSLFTPQRVASLLGGKAGVSHDMVGDSRWAQWLRSSAMEAAAMDSFTGVSWLELRSYLANTLLRDTDAMSMRNSLEVRVPFLDAPLVDYVLTLPGSQKRRGAQKKALLVEALQDLLPQEIVGQPKRTFTFPWERWLRGPLGERVAAGLADWSPALEAHIDGGVAMDVWKEFTGGRTTWSRPWSLYVLNAWVKRNLGVPAAEHAEQRKSAAVSIA